MQSEPDVIIGGGTIAELIELLDMLRAEIAKRHAAPSA